MAWRDYLLRTILTLISHKLHTVAVNLLGAARYSMEGKDAVFAVNVDGTKNVLEVSQECGVKAFVYTSSVTVLLDQLEENFKNADEMWSTGRATTLYGQSKVSQCLLSLSTMYPKDSYLALNLPASRSFQSFVALC